MQKWEYMVRKTDFKALSQPSFLELERTRLTEHGEEGWELVSAGKSWHFLYVSLSLIHSTFQLTRGKTGQAVEVFDQGLSMANAETQG
jgi:hypothetical protein